ncbi:GNAT family N-acetyltransferase [Fictibacillus aquaticus]|nr:GNAT family N-acetyltransferase [Fictibacillus aquaticus]
MMTANETLTIRQAEINESAEVMSLIQLCTEDMLSKHIFQWDEYYPNFSYIEETANANELYVLCESRKIIGAVVLNEWQSEEWDNVAWSDNSSQALIIHTLCLLPSEQGKGYGKKLLLFCEKFAAEQKYSCIRLDAFSGNKAALTLYESNRYIKRGEVQFSSKPAGHQTYFCYEKEL